MLTHGYTVGKFVGSGRRLRCLIRPNIHNDTKQVYRIPLNNANPPDFSQRGSLWLEFPDPFMSTIRNPTVGDQYNRYYFFPSDQYNSAGNNPSWPTTSPGPVYNTLARLEAGNPMYVLGVAAPTVPPTVTPPPSYITLVTTGATAINATVLQFAANSLAKRYYRYVTRWT